MSADTPTVRPAPAAAVAAMAAALLACAPTAPPARGAEPAVAVRAGPDFADVAERLLPTVVNIAAIRDPSAGPDIPDLPPGSPFDEFFRDFFGDGPPPRGPSSALGSGFLITPAGHVVTNRHVVMDARDIEVVLHDGEALPATVVGADPLTDLALLKVEAGRPLPAARWGTDETLRVGDWVVAIGNPFGLGGTVTAGILSARARDIRQGPYDEFLQTDAAINRGNSGGPLLDLSGRVVGINTAIFSPTGGSAGIGFAVPASLARPVVEQLMDTGDVRRGWLGVQVQEVTRDIAEGLGMDDARGALVVRVDPGGPAEAAGIRQGDVIVSVDGVGVDRERRLPRLVGQKPPGATVAFGLRRDGAERRADVRLGELDARIFEQASVGAPPRGDLPGGGLPGGGGGGGASPGPGARASEIAGIRLAPLQEALRDAYGIDRGVRGALVLGLVDGTAASYVGLLPGDVVTAVGTSEVSSPEEVRRAIDAARRGGRRVALLRVDRAGASLYLPLPLR